jgi:chromosome segregation ATPase
MDLEKEKSSLLEKINSYESSFSSIDKEKTKLQEELSFYQKQVQDLKKSKEELALELNQLKAKSNSDIRRIKELEEKLKEFGYTDEATKSLVVKLNNMLKEKDIEISKLKDELQKLKQEIQQPREQELSETDLMKLKEKISTMYNNFSEFLEELELLTWDEVMDKREVREMIKKMEKTLKEIRPEELDHKEEPGRKEVQE